MYGVAGGRLADLVDVLSGEEGLRNSSGLMCPPLKNPNLSTRYQRLGAESSRGGAGSQAAG